MDPIYVAAVFISGFLSGFGLTVLGYSIWIRRRINKAFPRAYGEFLDRIAMDRFNMLRHKGESDTKFRERMRAAFRN